MERDGRGGKGGKINQGEPDAEVMSRRTCANRSGSLAGGVAESNRTWLRTLTPLYLLYSLSIFFILFPVPLLLINLDVTPLHYVSCLPSPFLRPMHSS